MAETPIEGLDDLIEIGRGGFGVVYRATETELGRRVAVKMLPPLLDEGAQRRFDRERLALGAMSGHPHIVTVHRSGRTDDEQPYLVMEFCERGSIGDELERTGPLPWRRSTEIVVKLAGALETAHRAGIIHRDIKPANVLVSNLNEPKLADFGIARVDGAPETQSSSITASLAHAAPEVLDGRRPDARSDIYSLASTLFELLTGAPAFVQPGDDSMLPILTRIARNPVPTISPATAPPPVVDIVTRAMSKRPEDRPATAAEFGLLLAEAQRQAGIAPTAMMVESDVAVAQPEPGSAPDDSASQATRNAAGPFQAPEPAGWTAPPNSGSTPLAEANTVITDQAHVAPARASSRLPLLALAVIVALAGAGALVVVALNDNGGGGNDIATETTGPPTGSSGSTESQPTDGPETSAPETASEPVVANEPLTLGALFPHTGALSTFGPPLLAAAELAVEDVNAAGGVLGFDVALVSGDSEPDQLQAEASRFVDESVDVIIGPLTSASSTVLIEDPPSDAMVIISPSATAQHLTSADTTGTYFRTAPSEVTMGHVTAQILIDGGIDRLALIHIDDGYGTGLSEEIRFRYAQLGGVVVVNRAYDPSADISSVATELAEADAEGIVIIGFGETEDILASLREAGVGPTADGTPVFGVDANALLVGGNPATIDGYRSVIAGIDLRPLAPFTTRLEERRIDNLEFTPETYDAVIIAALAAEVSGATSGPELAAAVPGVTKNGVKCFDFAECKRLHIEGDDIDYDGLGGPYELTDDGDPRVASYLIMTYDGTSYDGEAEPNRALDEYVFSR